MAADVSPARSGTARSASVRREKRARLVLLALVVLAGSGCRRADDRSEQGGPAGSAVGIEAAGCGLSLAIGSGAVLAESGLVVTVAHTVAGAEEIAVIDGDGERHDATLRLLDPSSDIALLRVEGLAAPALPLELSPGSETRGQMLVWDRSTGIRAKPVHLRRRLLVTIEDIYLDADVARTAYELSGSIDSGDSGAVIVVDESVVGMLYARARDDGGRGFALDEQELSDALGDHQGVAAGADLDPGRCVP